MGIYLKGDNMLLEFKDCQGVKVYIDPVKISAVLSTLSDENNNSCLIVEGIEVSVMGSPEVVMGKIGDIS